MITLPLASSTLYFEKPTQLTVVADSLGSTTEDTGSYTTGEMKTALGMDLSIKETPQSVTVMTRARMDDQNINDISDVLDQTVGVTFNGTSALGSDGVAFYSRGFEIKNFQIDGTPRPPGIYGFSETTTDLAIYDRVEIVRGATGLMNGAGSPSATVNLVRKRPTEDSRVSVSTQAGSFDNYRLEADAGGSLTASGNVRARVVTAYQDSNSFVDRANIEKNVFYGILEADVTDKTLLTVGAEYQDFTNSSASRGGVPIFYANGLETDFSRSTNTGAEWSDFNHQTTRLFASLEHSFDNGWSMKLAGEQSRPDYDETIGYLYTSGYINSWTTGFDPITGEGANVLSSRWAGDLTQNIISLSASGPFQLLGREHEAMVGINHSTAEDDLNETYSAYASYADIFEPQNAVDVNRQHLPPLEGANYEGGIKGEFNDGRLNVSAAIFRIEQDNLAVAIPGAPLFEDGTAPSRAESGTVSKGFELEVAGEVAEGWQVGGGYANARAETADNNRMLTEVPKDTFKLFSSYQLPGQWNAVTVGGNLRWQSEVYTEGSGPNGEDFAQDSLALVDLMAKYAVTRNLSLTLNANNIFDKEYYSGLSWATGTYGEPRSFTLGARYSY